ncbi:ABC transporter ATP-binding protein [Nanoarchaeota archaeon]
MKALSIENLHKTYKSGTTALKGVSFDVDKGEFFGLLGPNGAGKTTTIGIITTLINKSEGKVSIFNKDLDTEPEQAKTFLGIVPQEFNFNIFEKVIDIVVQQAGYYGIRRSIALKNAEQFLKQLGLWEKRNAVANTLSGGMKRKLMIVRALIHKPKLLILDEPTAGVDVDTRRTMWTFLKKLNKKGLTIILTTHYLEEAEQLCKRIAIIDNGKLVENTSVKSLLKKLDKETFILDTKHAVKKFKPIRGYTAYLVDSTTIEADVKNDQNINDLIAALSRQNIEIISMRNKVNRLEELFVGMTGK